MMNFVFILHNHQPVGNFDEVIREAFNKSYKPFLDLIHSMPHIKVTLHFSGILYEWIEKKYPEYVDKIGEMIEKNQIELLSGGYYEPILSVIPERDRIKQIEKLNEYIKSRFNFVPQGLWLTERVWNRELTKTLAECGIKYTVLDDTHFFASGVKEEEVNSCFLTEYEGYKLNLFAINHNLRYLIPYSEPYRTIEYINKFGDGIFVMGDDGEKFGLWPESYKLVYQEKWLYNFFNALNSSNIKIKRLIDVFEELKERPKKLAYIPDNSYFEMTQWALETDSSVKLKKFWEDLSEDKRRFVRGGIFDNFFTKYEHSNMIHKRMLYLSKRLQNNYNLEAADYLYKSQCNCGWWHGVFGGIYLPHIRMAVYENILKAHRLIFDKNTRKNYVEETDINFDDKNEIIIETENNFFIVSPSYSGAITEFSSKNRFVNFSSVPQRKQEWYHLMDYKGVNLKKIESYKENLYYDWHLRANLLDHFLNPNTEIKDFYRAKYGEEGDFIPQEYSSKITKNNDIFIELNREGNVYCRGERNRFDVSKKIKISDYDGFEVFYSIKNREDKKVEVITLIELVFAFSSKKVADLNEIKNVREYIFNDEIRGNIKLEFDRDVDLWIIPIETVSNSEKGIEKTYQGSAVGVVVDNYYESYEEKKVKIGVKVL